jgi:hypothetical protein
MSKHSSLIFALGLAAMVGYQQPLAAQQFSEGLFDEMR